MQPMGQIKVVLIFNENDERQKEAGEFLKTKKRCKTEFVTDLVHAWMKNRMTDTISARSSGTADIEEIKKRLLQDSEFLLKVGKSMNYAENHQEDDEKGFDMDEDMMLSGLSMFESEF